MSKGIIYYTDNRLAEPIFSVVQKQILKSGLPIVSVSLKPIDFGKNIVLGLSPSFLTMLKQITTALEASQSNYVFFCFQGNTHIETLLGQKRIDEVKVGELVKTHLGRFRPVISVFVRPYKQRSPLIQIDCKYSSIRCTPEHPFYVYRGRNRQWVNAKVLKRGDVLLYPSKRTTDYLNFGLTLKSSTENGGYGKMEVRIGNIVVDNDLARFMGIYLAEGHYNGKNGIAFTFNNNEKEYQEFIEKVCYEKFNRKARKRTQWSTQILVNIKQLGPLFKKWFGDKASNKKVPTFVFNWNIKNRLAFIKGFLEGDGSKSIKDDSYYSFNVSSKKIVEDMIILMNKSGIGWDNIIKERRQTKFGSKKHFKNKKVYSINHSRVVFRKLKDILDSDWVEENYIGISIQNVRQAKMTLIPLYRNKIKTGEYADCVYNLEVEEDNSYIAQTAIVHNCEHDVLYPLSHFDFTPPQDNIFYYNANVWRWKYPDNLAITYDRLISLSGLCVNREFALNHYQQRLKKVKEMNWQNDKRHEPAWARKWGYEPGTKKTKRGGFSDDDFATWISPDPLIDIRHGKTFSQSKVTLDSFIHKPTNWQETTLDKIRSWDLKELFR